MRHAGAEAETLEITLEACAARRIGVERRQRDLRALENVAALAAGRGARIEHALTVGEVQAERRALRAGVLYRHVSALESRQSLERNRTLEQQRFVSER